VAGIDFALRLDGVELEKMPANSLRLDSASSFKADTVLDRSYVLPASTKGCPADPSFPEHVVRAALRDYCTSRDTAKAIAMRHGIDVKRLRRWVDAAGYPRRPLGRQPLTEPSSAQSAILAKIGFVPVGQLALEAQTSKQYLSELAKRWPDWVGGKQSRSHRAKSSRP